MNFKAIIFDMDGTIVETEHLWRLATQRLIERRGVEYTPELHSQLSRLTQGLATHKSCKIIKEIAKLKDPVDVLIAEKLSLANSMYRDGIKFIEGFPDFHNQLVPSGLKYGVATNADDTTVALTDEALNLKSYFGQHIYGISHVNFVCKPDPAIYLYAAQRLSVAPEECVAIEDSAHGIRAAKAAGMRCIGINTARKKEQVAEADLVIDSYSEISLEKIFDFF